MSPASKSKSKDKKTSKETQKASSKPSGSADACSRVPASAYNPLLGTFHAVETVPSSLASALQNNGHFVNIDESDEHLGGPPGAGIEYDSISNNGSWSGESEDHKDKTSNPPVRQEIIPGADNDKREKIRQKNERKHQRQKERRAQELHERCNGYLMSRKLEALAQQLVAMGFSHDRATMALILNDGKLEESVAWLFEGGEEAVKHKEPTSGILKINISEELSQIADMEVRYKCTRQEVERAVVTANGDLEKAAESLRTLMQDPPAPSKPEETCGPSTSSTDKVEVTGSQNLSARPHLKQNLSTATQQRKDEKDLNYSNSAVTMGGSLESVTKSFQFLNRIQPKMEWANPQQIEVPAEKRWPSTGSNPSFSYSLASPFQASPPPAKTESRHAAVVSDFKNILPSIREPVVMMQRSQPVNKKSVPATIISTSPPGTSFMYPTTHVEIAKSNGLMPHFPSTRSLNSNNSSSSQMHHQLYHQQHQHFTSSSGPGDSPGISRGNGLWSRTAASSLGLFTGLGSTTSSGGTSPVDWSSGSTMAQLDYTNIDWSLDRGLSSSPRPGEIWLGPSTSPMKSFHMYYPYTNGFSAKPAMRLTSNGKGVPIVGLLDSGVASAKTSTAASHEWTSPFEGKDLFSLPSQFVSPPSL
ncbi:hypothetical protein V6N13_139359 [Hibiscus sabdariffa]|uniref:UBA domain-containing protein n=1 Tax=Hibiscus sabdariffa TaxID=183260 RepID=A0ABR2C8D4_9ROSI